MEQYSIQESLPGVDFWQWALDDNKAVERLEHNLKGEEYDETNDKWIRTSTPQLNDLGVKEIMSDLKFLLYNNTFKLTTLTDDEIHEQTYDLTNSVRRSIIINWQRYGIKKPYTTNIERIIMRFNTLCFSLLMRCKDGATLRALRETMHRTENVSNQTVSQDQKKGGMFGLPL